MLFSLKVAEPHKNSCASASGYPKPPRSAVKTRVFFPTPRSAHFIIYVVDKGIYTSSIIPRGTCWASPLPLYTIMHTMTGGSIGGMPVTPRHERHNL